MSVHIEDHNALELLGQLEGTKWLEAQQADIAGEHPEGFYHVLRERAGLGDHIIYGADDTRYTICTKGYLVLIGNTSSAEKDAQAELLGIHVRGPRQEEVDRASTQTEQEQPVFETHRRNDLVQLCHALLEDVAIGLNYTPDEAYGKLNIAEEEMLAVMAARITSWANHRLGIVDAALMVDLSVVARQMARSESVTTLTGDIFVNRPTRFGPGTPPES